MIDERRLQLLLDKQDIYELMCRYCRGVDRMDKELTLSCFWPGAIPGPRDLAVRCRRARSSHVAPRRITANGWPRLCGDGLWCSVGGYASRS